jgi:aspartate/methionine/tyrosine aminotransferase
VELLNKLPGVSCIKPMGAFYAFPNIEGTGYSANALQNKLLEEVGVAVIAGTSFGALGENYLRVSYANSIDNIKLAIERMREVLSDGKLS